MTLDRWLENHPYLEPIARLDTEVERAIAKLPLAPPGIPTWDAYFAEYRAGVPLLDSRAAAIDLGPLENALSLLISTLKCKPLPNMVPEASDGVAQLNGTSGASPRMLLSFFERESAISGLMQYLSWKLLSRYLSPVIRDFSSWREEERWLLHYCPVCGSPPAMAQLVGSDPGRLRLLVCGRCGSRWRTGGRDARFAGTKTIIASPP